MSDRSFTSGEDHGRVAASATYILYLLAPFTVGLSALGGVIWAWKMRASASGAPREHLDHQVRLFWVGLAVAAPIAVLGFFGDLTKIILIGYPIAAVAWLFGAILVLWWLWRTVTGLMRVSAGRPPKG